MRRAVSASRWPRFLLLAALLVAAIATSGAYAERDAAAAVVAVDTPEEAAVAGKSDEASAQLSGKQAKVPEFVATNVWQELLPGQGIPKVSSPTRCHANIVEFTEDLRL